MANLRSLGIGVSNHASDNQQLIPPAQMPKDPEDSESRMVGWDERIAPYVPFSYQGVMKGSLEARKKSILVCPAEKNVATAGDYTYAQNIDLNYRLLGRKALVRLTSLSNLSQYVIFSDSYRTLTLSTGTAAKLKESINPKPERHGGFPNFLYADGHVAPFTHPLVGYNEVTANNRQLYYSLWFANASPPHLR